LNSKNKQKKESDDENSDEDPEIIMDNYGDIDDANDKTFEAFMMYLGLPKEKTYIIERIKQVQNEKYYNKTYF
jgi:hypothetical protein